MKNMVRKLSLVLFLSASFVSAACNSNARPTRLTIISTNDFHGHMDAASDSDLGQRSHGGFGWMLGYFKTVRQDNPTGVILLDGGDLWQGTLLSNMTKGEAVIALYNAAGYDAVALGNHEFDFGAGDEGSSDLRHVLKSRLKEAKFPMLAANVLTVEDRKPLELPNFKPYTIIERQGVKVGIIGLATPSTKETTLAKNIKDLTFTDPASAVHRYSKILRQEGAKVVIVLTHLGATWDEKKQAWSGELVDLIKEIRGEVDLAVGAHTHTIISERIFDVPVMSAGFYGRSFTRADILLDKNGTILATNLEGPTFFFHKSTSSAPPTYRGRPVYRDDSFDATYEKYYKKVAEIVNKEYGETTAEISNHGEYDTPMGHVAADAMLAASAGEADIAMTNRGGLRTSLPAGKITYGDIFKVIPFDNEMVIVTVTGEQLVSAWEHGLNSYYWPLEIGGITVYFEKSSTGNCRVTKAILQDGRQLDRNAMYRVATNDFLYGGGDGYGYFNGGVAKNTNLALRTVLADYLAKNSPITAAKEPRYVVENTQKSDK